MKIIDLTNEPVDGDVFKTIEVGEEPVRVTYPYQIDDLLITADGGDYFMSWDMLEWDDNQCILIREKDNFKEISGLTSKIILYKSKDGGKVTLYTCAQRN